MMNSSSNGMTYSSMRISRDSSRGFAGARTPVGLPARRKPHYRREPPPREEDPPPKPLEDPLVPRELPRTPPVARPDVVPEAVPESLDTASPRPTPRRTPFLPRGRSSSRANSAGSAVEKEPRSEVDTVLQTHRHPVVK